MKKKLLAGIIVGAALCIGVTAIAVPNALINSSAPSVPSGSLADETAIKGEVFYLQRSALPPHATLFVQLVDVTKGNGPAKIMAETVLQPQTQVPITFSLPIKAEMFKLDHLYALQARIAVGDALWYVSERTPVLENETNTYYRIKLNPMSQNETGMIRHPELKGQQWLVEDLFGGGVIDNSHITVLINKTENAADIGNEKKFRVSGTGGCNRYTSTAIIDEENKKIRFEPPAMTFIACTKAISMQENRFIDMLTKAKSYALDDVGRLFFKNEQDEDIGRLVPINE